MSALVAARHDPTIRASRERPRAAGELARLAPTAVVHEPLVILDATLEHGMAWDARRIA